VKTIFIYTRYHKITLILFLFPFISIISFGCVFEEAQVSSDGEMAMYDVVTITEEVNIDEGIIESIEEIGEEPIDISTDKLSDESIYNHAIYFAHGRNEMSWKLVDTPIIKHASVPDLLVLDQGVGEIPDGALVSYFVDTSPLANGFDETISYSYSLDKGTTWSERVEITVIGDVDVLPVDPSVVQLEDGRLRLYFFDFFHSRIPEQLGPSIFYSALSEDGIHFTIEDVALESDEPMTDPDVVYFQDEWFMYYARHDYAGGSVWLAKSTDGITFINNVQILDISGIPGAMVTHDKVHIYGCDIGISYATSSNGIVFAQEGSVLYGNIQENPLICDPSPTPLKDGTFGLVVKQIFSE